MCLEMNNETKLLHFVRSVARFLFLGYLPLDLREDVPSKFILTQFAGVAVSMTVSILCMFNINPLYNLLCSYSSESNKLVNFIIAITFLWAIFFASLYLWGKILFLLGILTVKEAKGYPFSKPWAKNINKNK